METFGRAIRSMSLMAPMFLWCSGNPVTPTLKVTGRFAHFWISFKAFSFEYAVSRHCGTVKTMAYTPRAKFTPDCPYSHLTYVLWLIGYVQRYAHCCC